MSDLPATGAAVIGRGRELFGRDSFGRGLEMVLEGSIVIVDGAVIQLSDRERAVLEALADAQGAVVTKRSLARTVWGHGADEHRVEVTISRLRCRLGPAGSAIETIPRRGYRLA
jgi:DNA-binding winged helix-turn-helix (wHTH) protein